jgi:3-oxoacyl-[acyl-carrier protein] reductase
MAVAPTEVARRSTLVTGGSRGIGAAIVDAFRDCGDAVTATRRDSAPGTETGSGTGGLPLGDRGPLLWATADVTDAGGVDRAFAAAEAAHGPVEVAVANAGITRDGLVLRMSDADFAAVVDTNLAGAFRVARRAAKSMLRLRRGRIVLVSSVVGLLGSAGQANYAASKAGLVGLARSLARELGSRGITVNVVAPGLVDTDMTRVLDDDRRAQVLSGVPLGRMASPQEVAAVVRWLAGPDAAYITGAVIPVDGGLGMGH